MLEHTKKLPIELKFSGPSTNKTKALKALKSFGFVNISDTVPWRDLFPEYADEEMPGICLAGSRHKENMTQKQLSELTGIPQSHISAMKNGKRAIGKKTAKILAKVLSVNYRMSFDVLILNILLILVKKVSLKELKYYEYMSYIKTSMQPFNLRFLQSYQYEIYCRSSCPF